MFQKWSKSVPKVSDGCKGKSCVGAPLSILVDTFVNHIYYANIDRVSIVSIPILQESLVDTSVNDTYYARIDRGSTVSIPILHDFVV
eukprot:418934-Heterocapsa_arctica.AAC.1